VYKILGLFINSLFMTKIIFVWCAMSGRRLAGPILHDDTVNAVRYVNSILLPLTELREEERLCGVFQRDSPTAHTSHVSWEAPREVSMTA
jgi:hypothetical protein